MSSLFRSTKNTRVLNGGTIQKLQYIRSDVPDALSEDEIQWLISHNIRTLVDLRNDKEVLLKPCPLRQRDEFTYINMPITGGSSIPTSADDVSASYITMVDNMMDGVLKTIESAKNGVMFFCNAGKDRTGVVSAILLYRAGVDRQKIIDDYVASYDNLREMLEHYVIQNPSIDIEVITPKPVYMERFLDYISS